MAGAARNGAVGRRDERLAEVAHDRRPAHVAQAWGSLGLMGVAERVVEIRLHARCCRHTGVGDLTFPGNIKPPRPAEFCRSGIFADCCWDRSATRGSVLPSADAMTGRRLPGPASPLAQLQRRPAAERRGGPGRAVQRVPSRRCAMIARGGGSRRHAVVRRLRRWRDEVHSRALTSWRAFGSASPRASGMCVRPHAGRARTFRPQL